VTAPFTFNTAPSIRFGNGLLADLGSMVAATGQKRVLLVTDPGMMATDIVGQALASLDDAGIESSVYSDVEADPPEAVVHAACDAARATDAGLVIGLGGGSSMDAAKLVALLVSGSSATVRGLWCWQCRWSAPTADSGADHGWHRIGSDADFDYHHRQKRKDGRGVAGDPA
jgi:alcohol dehydrogenase class IV